MRVPILVPHHTAKLVQRQALSGKSHLVKMRLFVLVLLLVCLFSVALGIPSPRARGRPQAHADPHARKSAHMNQRINMMERRINDMQSRGDHEGASRLSEQLEGLKRHQAGIESRVEEDGIPAGNRPRRGEPVPPRERGEHFRPDGMRPEGPRRRGMMAHMSRRLAKLDDMLNNAGLEDTQKEGMLAEQSALQKRFHDMFGEEYNPAVHNAESARVPEGHH
jgi:hypothetical protein